MTKIEQPSELAYNQWVEIETFQNSADRATSTITAYEHYDRSQIMELIRLRCSFDVQLHQGTCEDPRDFDGGWQKVKIFENAKATSLGGSDLGAMEGGNQGSVTEEMPFSARDVYDVLRMTYREVAKNEVGEVVVAVDVCDLVTCGDCEGVSGDGCQKVFALTNSAGSSPGLKPQVIITTDQYGTNALIERWVTTILTTENAVDGACVGQYFVVLQAAPTTGGIHYAETAEMVDSAETWTEVLTGLVTGKGPNCIWNYSPLTSFIGGLGGYIYLMKNPADGVTVLDAGSATTQNLTDISGWDATKAAAVGVAGAFVYTTDGYTWALGAAPVGPTDLQAVAYRQEQEIWVGGTANGNVFYTTDFGAHWYTKALPGALSQVDSIVWASESVGFIAGRTAATKAKILRTINGGYTWYVVPESASQSIPDADYILDMAVCQKEVNKLFAGGLADNGSDGVIIKGSDQ